MSAQSCVPTKPTTTDIFNQRDQAAIACFDGQGFAGRLGYLDDIEASRKGFRQPDDAPAEDARCIGRFGILPDCYLLGGRLGGGIMPDERGDDATEQGEQRAWAQATLGNLRGVGHRNIPFRKP